ncbi:glycosyltransferase family 2 protein [Actinomycetospora atypica]|uniref:Glycosyltransferase family 2 protein n=1 Tax=Actinomycetospora atypica TaxID=1290095 RepID=A0ABV9YG75_9PSEU
MRAAVVVPVGPGPAEFVDDTLASVRDRLGVPHTLVVVNDSPRRTWPPGVVVVAAPPRAPGGQGGLFVKLAAGIRCAVQLGGFDVLLRLDTDALVLRPGVVDAARRRFEADPSLGLLGAVRVGPDGGARSFAPAAAALRAEAGLRGLVHPLLRRRLRSGPLDGVHALGGAYLLSAACCSALMESGWLEAPELALSRAGEDHLMGAAVRACGFSLGEFSRPGDPLAVRWIGLPDSPAAVWASGACVTHSVRSWGVLDEAAVRAEFRSLCSSGVPS